MNVRRVNRGLWTLTAALAAAAFACAVLGVVVPVEAPVADTELWRRPAATSQASPDSQLPLSAFESIWALNLRKPLTESAADAARTTDANPTTMATGGGGPFVLVGTIGNSVALVRAGAGGAIEVKGVGEQVNGAKIVAIRPMQVDVEVGGARMTIVKPREGSGG
jgi:hypothetical protein